MVRRLKRDPARASAASAPTRSARPRRSLRNTEVQYRRRCRAGICNRRRPSRRARRHRSNLHRRRGSTRSRRSRNARLRQHRPRTRIQIGLARRVAHLGQISRALEQRRISSRVVRSRVPSSAVNHPRSARLSRRPRRSCGSGCSSRSRGPAGPLAPACPAPPACASTPHQLGLPSGAFPRFPPASERYDDPPYTTPSFTA